MEDVVRVHLPGGLPVGGDVRRDACLKPLTGQLEYEIARIDTRDGNLPRAVSSILGEAVQSVGGQSADRDLAGQLCIADRQYLMLALARLVRGDRVWLTHTCTACGAAFDLDVSLTDLPVQPPGAGYPLAHVQLGASDVVLRLPNGADQERLLGLSTQAALELLMQSCVVSVDGRPPEPDFVSTRSEADIQEMEAALDGMSPYLGTTLATRCPECNEPQRAEIDPYAITGLAVEGLLGEVHAIASRYHWSEEQILKLTRERRRFYLRMIDRDRGMVS